MHGTNDPRAAYALGMLFMLAKIQTSASRTRDKVEEGAMEEAAATEREIVDHSEPSIAWAQPLHRAKQVLESPHVAVEAKDAFVEMVEEAVDWPHVVALIDAFYEEEDPMAIKLTGEQRKLLLPLQENPSALSTDHHTEHTTVAAVPVEIPATFGCAICCADLMLKPASLACGHSFCKCCLDLWLQTCSTCPSCRHPTMSLPQNQVAVNLALQEMLQQFYPVQIKEMENSDHMERLNRIRALLHESLDNGGNCSSSELRAMLAQDQRLHGGSSQDQSLAVALLLKTDVELQEKILAVEIRERLRKERLLRENSRRRHVAAYSHGYAPPLDRTGRRSDSSKSHRSISAKNVNNSNNNNNSSSHKGKEEVGKKSSKMFSGLFAKKS